MFNMVITIITTYVYNIQENSASAQERRCRLTNMDI